MHMPTNGLCDFHSLAFVIYMRKHKVIHKTTYCNGVRRTESYPQVTCTEVRNVIFGICEQTLQTNIYTYRQSKTTYRYVDYTTSHPFWGNAKMPYLNKI